VRKGSKGLSVREQHIGSSERVEHWGRLVAFVAFVSLAILLTSCGLFRRERQRETPTPLSPVSAVRPTEITVAPTTTVSPTTTASPRTTVSQLGPTVTGGIAIGIYQPQANTSGAAIDRYISQAGRKPAFAWLPMTWQHLDGSFWQFDPQMLEEFRTRGIMPALTWDPSKGSTEAYTDFQAAVNQTEFSWKQINSGRYDAYITQFAKDAAAYHYPFIVRVLHEMDGTWYPWGFSVNGNTNIQDFVNAFKHIVDIFRAAGATNVQFVWNPTAVGAAAVQTYGGLLRQAYPGDNYVDWIALDGYNLKLDNWLSLQEVFQPAYGLLTSFSKRPMILWEVGSLENPQDPMAKANWIKQGFLTTIPNDFPAVKVAAWFNSKDGSGRDFSLQTSQNAMDAWKQVVSSPLYQGSLLK
jgi:mannan endo-1,4-beta-mannosidase